MQPPINEEISLDAQYQIKEIEKIMLQHIKNLTRLHEESSFMVAKLCGALEKRRKILQNIILTNIEG